MYSSIFVFLATFAIMAAAKQPQALVYRGKHACNGCPEAVANLLMSSESNFAVQYVGENEKIKFTKEAFSKVDVFAYPGGPDLDKAAAALKPYNKIVQNFVAAGGRYLGFCLGAYMAGTPGFGLLPSGVKATEEIDEPGAEVKNGKNTIIQVDWTFSTGALAGQTEKQWMFFQDGSAIIPAKNTANLTVLARYASNQDIAATLSPYGKGWVGTTGPHPEADETWYSPYHIHNPDGINFTIGYDFVETVWGQK